MLKYASFTIVLLTPYQLLRLIQFHYCVHVSLAKMESKQIRTGE
jgi:hypothetical protein